jgi:hypothetical protein
VRLHYPEKGEGEPLVLLHGNTTMGNGFYLERPGRYGCQTVPGDCV